MNWRKLPLPADEWPPLETNPMAMAGLVTSLPEEHEYECRIIGDLPPLEGTLYRIGPGLYDRGPDRKRMVLDGDGMIQALTLTAGRARYRNRFVRTEKLAAESAAGRFLYPTFSTHGSGPFRYNLGLSLANQANTTVLAWGDKVFAFDEGQVPYALTRDLDTIGERAPHESHPRLRYWAHWKLDANRRCVHLLAIEQGPRSVANVVSLGPDGRVASHQRINLPRSVYFHDWFVTERYFAFLLHPAYISPAKMLQVLIARETFSEALSWQPDKGSLLLVFDRGSGRTHTLSTEARWMWHAVNAYDTHETLVCDFVGNVSGGGLGEDSTALFQIMRGHLPDITSEPANAICRYRVDLKQQTIDEQIIDDSANFELPCVSATERAKRFSKAYLIQATPAEVFARSLCQLDEASLTTRAYTFAEGEYCSEPVFLDALAGPRGRHVATQVYDSRRKTSYFAVFDEVRFDRGPVATIELEHHAPLSFHGYWSQGDYRR